MVDFVIICTENNSQSAWIVDTCICMLSCNLHANTLMTHPPPCAKNILYFYLFLLKYKNNGVVDLTVDKLVMELVGLVTGVIAKVCMSSNKLLKSEKQIQLCLVRSF